MNEELNQVNEELNQVNEELNQVNEELDQVNEDFDQMVNDALALSAEERSSYVVFIAHELRMLSKEFYTTLSIADLRQGTRVSSLLIKQYNYFNRLSDYFVTKIVNQPATNVVNSLKFLIQLTQELYSSGTEPYTDLNHLMVISSVINSVKISRLTSYFEALTAKEHKILDELKNLTNDKLNFKWMRETGHINSQTLPFPGMLYADLIFAKEKNPRILFQAEISGALLLNVLKIKQGLLFFPIIYKSNLPSFLNNYQFSDDNELYYASQRLELKPNVILKLETTIESIDQALDELDYNYLVHGLIPRVIFFDSTYPASQLGNKLIECFTLSLSSFENELQTKNELVLTMFDKLQHTLGQLVEVSNRYYQGTLSEQLRSFHSEEKMNQLKDIIEGKVPLVSLNPKQAIERKSRVYRLFFPRASSEKGKPSGASSGPRVPKS